MTAPSDVASGTDQHGAVIGVDVFEAAGFLGMSVETLLEGYGHQSEALA